MAELKFTQQAMEAIATQLANANPMYTPHVEIYLTFTSTIKWNFKLPVKYTTTLNSQPCSPFWEFRRTAGTRINTIEFQGELPNPHAVVVFHAARQYQAGTLSSLADQIKHDGFTLSIMKGMQPIDSPKFASDDVKSIKVLL
jgi:hypothetical protein